MTLDRRTWLDSLAAGDGVAVDISGLRFLGKVVKRTRGGRIRARWSGGEALFYGTDVCPAGEIVGGRSSREPARLEPAGVEIAAADDLAAIADRWRWPELAAAEMARMKPEALARLAALAADLRAELDRLAGASRSSTARSRGVAGTRRIRPLFGGCSVRTPPAGSCTASPAARARQGRSAIASSWLRHAQRCRARGLTCCGTRSPASRSRPARASRRYGSCSGTGRSA